MIDETLLRAFITMMVCVGAIAGLLWLVKRKMTTGKQGNTLIGIEIIARQGLNTKAQIFVVSVHSKTLLLGVTEQSVTMLAELDSLPQTATHPQQSTTTSVPINPASFTPNSELFNQQNIGQFTGSTTTSRTPTASTSNTMLTEEQQKLLQQQLTFGSFIRSIFSRT
jgi:flagellar biogenesis protein FliO